VAYLGATMQLPEKDRYTESRKKLLGMLAGAMGGRVARRSCSATSPPAPAATSSRPRASRA
jgi:hypothetical protein